ncbi:zinc ion binding / nucleic acid binding protein [Thalictrum thalictroides]|uniref:Zinc ion binding / nucleic acid binding protein n=1 Tax=Thalictrum thalictroides TaxID=46969 RepID=A0A7J6X6E5_THATH|nr:zinc ion binding / nucleic acid binding protein [Thalictrum thalictroides]
MASLEQLPSSQVAWSSLFKSNSSFDVSLSKCETSLVDGIATVPQEIMEEGSKDWKDFLIGYFIDKKLPFHMVKNALTKTWKLKGSFTMTTDEDVFYFKFNAPEDKRMILEQGPVFIAGRLFVTKQWSEELDINKNKLGTLPIWIKIWNLPKLLWNKKGLSFVASLLGNPLFTDEATCKKERLNFAKVCVEIPADFRFAKSLQLNMGGSVVNVNLEYPWKPAICNNCKRFGHKERKCPNVVSRVWTSKNVEKGQASCVRDELGNPLEKEVENVVTVVNIEPQAATNPAGVCEHIGSGNRFEALNEVEEEHDHIPQVTEKVVSNANAEVQPSITDLVVHTSPTEVERVPCSLEVVPLNTLENQFALEVVLNGEAIQEDVQEPISDGEVQQYEDEKELYLESSDDGYSTEKEDDIDEPEFFKDHLEVSKEKNKESLILATPEPVLDKGKGPETSCKQGSKSKTPKKRPRGRPKGSCKKH